MLLTKIKGEKDWKQNDNLECMGTISQPQWHKLWPAPKLPELTSPPQGRNYTHKKDKLHNISSDSDSSSQDHNKKQKLEDTNTASEGQEHDQSHTKPKEGQVRAWSAFLNSHGKHTEAPAAKKRDGQTWSFNFICKISKWLFFIIVLCSIDYGLPKD